MKRWLQRNDITTDWVRWAVGVLFVVGLCCPWLTKAEAAAPTTVKSGTITTIVQKPRVDDTLRALAKLRSFGYTVNTTKQADRAIRHWQKVNGLVVDGDVGIQTLDSLGLSATASLPAVRVNPPAPQPIAEPVGDTESIIRAVWPDELEDKAVRIAKRESGPDLVVTAHNSCCFGLFQVYFRVHRAWLADYGVFQPSDLYDPFVNATVAYVLYQRALAAYGNGWQPWGG